MREHTVIASQKLPATGVWEHPWPRGADVTTAYEGGWAPPGGAINGQ